MRRSRKPLGVGIGPSRVRIPPPPLSTRRPCKAALLDILRRRKLRPCGCNWPGNGRRIAGCRPTGRSRDNRIAAWVSRGAIDLLLPGERRADLAHQLDALMAGLPSACEPLPPAIEEREGTRTRSLADRLAVAGERPIVDLRVLGAVALRPASDDLGRHLGMELDPEMASAPKGGRPCR